MPHEPRHFDSLLIFGSRSQGTEPPIGHTPGRIGRGVSALESTVSAHKAEALESVSLCFNSSLWAFLFGLSGITSSAEEEEVVDCAGSAMRRRTKSGEDVIAPLAEDSKTD